MSKRTLSHEKTLTWNAFSKLIRLRDAILTTGDIYDLVCITCDRRKDIKTTDAGHWQSRRYSSTLFDPRNVHGQCKQCNGPFNGMPEAYRRKLQSIYHESLPDELYNKRTRVIRFDKEELQNARSAYMLLCKKLMLTPEYAKEINSKLIEINEKLCRS